MFGCATSTIYLLVFTFWPLYYFVFVFSFRTMRHMYCVSKLHNTISLFIVIQFKSFLGGNLGSIWIGASDVGKQDWRWAFDLSKVTYSLFNPGQPDNGGNVEGCLELRSELGYKWNDFPCSSTNSYVCESQQVIVIFFSIRTFGDIDRLRLCRGFVYICVHSFYR